MKIFPGNLLEIIPADLLDTLYYETSFSSEMLLVFTGAGAAESRAV